MSYNKNTIRKNEKVSLYTSSNTATYIQNNANTEVRGESVSSQTTEEVSVTPATFSDVDTLREQNNNFCSTTDRNYYPIDPSVRTTEDNMMASNLNQPVTYTDHNLVKGIEKDVGDLQSFASDKSSESKDVRVTHNMEPSIKEEVEDVIEEETSKETTSVNNGWNTRLIESLENHWGFKGRDTTSIKVINGTPKQPPYVMIIEDREGNSAFTNRERDDGRFSTGSSSDIIKLEILRSVENFSFGTRQEFDSIEPRGSQTPMRFYNKNQGRTLDFSADFHQQEYPLEPLLSIAEKAQYFCRPYRHGDYAVIPKLVRVEIPGRVFRGYMQEASCTYKGDDYRSWALLKLNESNIGRLGYLPEESSDRDMNGVYGYNPRIEYRTNRIRNDNSKDAIDYGLSELNIHFSLLITEEIVLTSYETKAERDAQEKALTQEKEKRELDEAIEKARSYMERANQTLLNKRTGLPLTPEDLVVVDAATGKYLGLKINESGQVVDDAFDDKQTMTVSEWRQSAAINSKTSNKSSGTGSIVQNCPPTATRPADSDTMLNYLVSKEKEKYPTYSDAVIKEELKKEYSGDPSKLLDAYASSIKEATADGSNLSSDQAFFLQSSYKISLTRTSKGDITDSSMVISIDSRLQPILDNKLRDEKDLKKFLGDFGCNDRLVDLSSERKIQFGGMYVRFRASSTHQQKSGPEYIYYVAESEELHDFIFMSNKSEFESLGLFQSGGDFENMYLDLNVVLAGKHLTSQECDKLSGENGYKTDKIEMKAIYNNPDKLKLIGDTAPLTYVLTLMKKFKDTFYTAFRQKVNYLNEKFKSESKTSGLSSDIIKIIDAREAIVLPDKESYNNQISLHHSNPIGKLPQISESDTKIYDDFTIYHHNYVYYIIN